MSIASVVPARGFPMLSPLSICPGWENPFLPTFLDSQVSWFFESLLSLLGF